MFKSRFVKRLVVASGFAVAGGTSFIYISNQKRYKEALKFAAYNEKPSTLWQPPSRAEIINRLQGKSADGSQVLSKDDAEFDILIVGCGATGSGCAVDAASRGLKVACVERDDFSSGTSSKSTKLVHGGVRYLEKAIKQLDYEQFKLVSEALRERFTFLHVAPYLANQLPIMLPIYKWYMVPYYWAGSKAYDLLSGFRGLERSYYLSKSKALDAFPMLKKDDLVGAMVYYDGQMNDSRMNVALALTAVNLGATVANYVEVLRLVKENQKITGAILKDRLTGDEWEVKAKGVINATGPFSDGIRKMDDPTVSEIVSPSAGVHVVLPSYFGPRSMGLVDPSTSDGRVIFFLPWEGCTIAGTTDTPTSLTMNPEASDADVNFIINEVSRYLNNDISIRKTDILAVWSGIRPLVRDPAAPNTEGLVRNHMINLSPSGLLTIAGGKWTTYRSMAEETIDKAIEAFGLKPARACVTEHLLLIGSHTYSDTMYLKLIQQYGFEVEVAQYLCRNYGDRAFTIAAMAEMVGTRWPFFGKRLVQSHPFIEAEVKYAVRNEYAVKATDVLARRTRLAFVDCQSAYEALPKVISIMAHELNWDKKRQEQEFTDSVNFLNSMGLNLITPYQSIFSKDVLLKFRKEFSALDVDGDGIISLEDLNLLLKRTGIKMDPETVIKMIEEIDVNKNGSIELVEFLQIMSNVEELKTKIKFSKFMKEFEKYVNSLPTERSGGGL